MSTGDPTTNGDLPASEPAPEGVEVSLLFCDVVRSTELTRRLGDLGAYRVIQDFHNLVLGAAAPFAGRELELRGDGVLLAFDAPGQAVDCAVEIQRGLQRVPVGRRVSARIGVHTGQALRVASGYFGSNVILSARVAEEAAPGEILVTAAIVQRLAEQAPPVDAGRWVSLKGIPEANLVFALRWRPRRSAPMRPPCSSAAHTSMVHTLGRVAESRVKDDAPSCMLAERGGV